jgi:hypothetical protein
VENCNLTAQQALFTYQFVKPNNFLAKFLLLCFKQGFYMKNFLLLSLLFLSMGAWAQRETKSGGIAIPKGNTTVQPSQTTATPNPDSPFKLKHEDKKIFEGPKFTVSEKKEEFTMIEENKFVSRSSEFEQRAAVTPQGESNEAYRGNQFFGEVRSKSKFIQVLARDFQYVDGDRIKVMVNGKTVVEDITLDNNFKGIQLTLSEGFNKIDFEALNQGTSGPNTAEFRVYDDKEQVISTNQWNLATGFKASIIIVKESDSLSEQQATEEKPN